MPTTRRQVLIETATNAVRNGDVKAALDEMRAYLSNGLTSVHEDLISLTARFNRLDREKKDGLIDRDEYRVETNELIRSLLDLLHRFPEPPSLQTPDLAEDFDVPEDAGLEKIIGANNLRQIAWLEQGTHAACSVCRIITPAGQGTGFLIASGLVLTNNHVLPSASALPGSRAEFNYQNDANGQLLPSHRYKFDDRQFVTNEALDFTLVALLSDPTRPPLDQWGIMRLNPENEPLPNEHVVIIQHPEGGPKQICLTANQVVNIWEHRLQYTTDTLPGSSGAPVCNERWEVIALHHAGGNLKVNAKGERRFVNEGILLSHIRAAAGGFWPH